ncbi:MAG: alkaline phosphatase family protein [Armatimonadetes bacterium]|nr:alkaline phosphatase family protein [Armatimonadota bacterium]
MDQSTKRRMVIIGVDGATFDLIKPWVAEGKLPTFARMLREGTHAPLRSVISQRSAAAWTSFATGKNPGKHGIYDFWHRVPHSYAIRFINGSARIGKAVWDYVSDECGRAIVMNVPMTYPAKPVNGILISGMDAPGIDSASFSYPPEAIDELLKANGGYVIEPGVTSLCIAGKYGEAISAMKQAAELRYLAARHLMENHPWDLFIVVFRETDPIQHTFWKFMDSTHPDHDPELAALYGEAIFEVYDQLDRLIGQLIDKVPSGVPVLVLSDHGFGINQGGNEHLPAWLEGRGLMRFTTAEAGRRFGQFGGFLQTLVVHGISALFDQVHRRTSRKTKERLSRWFPQVREKVQAHLTLGGVDWSTTLAFADGARENIWINLKGREPEGIVEPGEDYDALVSRIAKELLVMTDIKTGEPVVEAVHRGTEVYHGDYLDQAADLIIQWKEHTVISGLASPDEDPKGRRSHRRVCYLPGEEARHISGYHRLHGILIAVGEGIKRGTHVPEAEIVDIAPTILHMMGLGVPEDMDGRILTEILLDETQAVTVRRGTNGIAEAGAEPALTQGEEEVYSEEDAAKIAERLKGLGYL